MVILVMTWGPGPLDGGSSVGLLQPCVIWEPIFHLTFKLLIRRSTTGPSGNLVNICKEIYTKIIEILAPRYPQTRI